MVRFSLRSRCFEARLRGKYVLIPLDSIRHYCVPLLSGVVSTARRRGAVTPQTPLERPTCSSQAEAVCLWYTAGVCQCRRSSRFLCAAKAHQKEVSYVRG